MNAAHRIALDARRLAGYRRGIGLYVQNLVRCLPKAAPEAEFLLLVDRPVPSELVPAGCRQIVVGWRPSADSQSVGQFGAQFNSVYWMNVLVPSVLKRERADLFHGTNVAVPLLGRSRSVATIHDLVSMRVPGTYTAFYERYRKLSVPVAARHASHLVAVSESTKRDVVELIGIRPEKVTVVHHGVDASFAPVVDPVLLDRVRRQLSLPQRFIVHVGAVERQKRLEPLMHAAAEILKKGLIDAVVLAGEEGYGAEAVRSLVAELGIAERVRFLGYVSQEFIPALYSLARCAVYPSWYEGFGMPVLEAMACGTPIVASNTSSLPEVAGDAALLISPGDDGALARVLERLLTDDHLRNDLARRGIERARQFSWETCASRHADVYRRVLRDEQ
jgi:glycosyltransferase involved in cell wall biosynthesis